jgi:hypothetical protein
MSDRHPSSHAVLRKSPILRTKYSVSLSVPYGYAFASCERLRKPFFENPREPFRCRSVSWMSGSKGSRFYSQTCTHVPIGMNMVYNLSVSGRLGF